jgi:hypothetical protein
VPASFLHQPKNRVLQEPPCVGTSRLKCAHLRRQRSGAAHPATAKYEEPVRNHLRTSSLELYPNRFPEYMLDVVRSMF